MDRQPELVTPEQVRAAVAELERRHAAGEIGAAEVARRINDCRRAVTPRDLWRASGGLAGSPHRSDWWDVRRTVASLLFLLVLLALATWLVTWALGFSEGGIGLGPAAPPRAPAPS